MTTIGELRAWLQGFRDENQIAIDDGGLTLEVIPVGETIGDGRADDTYEIGGWPVPAEGDQ